MKFIDNSLFLLGIKKLPAGTYNSIADVVKIPYLL